MKTMIFASILFCSALHAMHDAKTELDRVTIEKAKAQQEKTEADEDGLLGALGSHEGASLIAQVAQDRKKYEEQKMKKENTAKEPERKAALIAWQQECSKSGKFVGFKNFFDLSYPLQALILNKYCRGNERALYALHHKRELVPFMLRHGDWFPAKDARSILNQIDSMIQRTRGTVDALLKRDQASNTPIMRSKLLCFFQMTLLHESYGTFAGVSPKDKWFDDLQREPGIVLVLGYSDRTYDIRYNRKQFVEFVNDYSLEQLQFLVSLVRPDRRFTLDDAKIFQTLDPAMQQLIQARYSWIDFDNPEEELLVCSDVPIMGIDERIEQAQNKFFVYANAWMRWAVSKVQAFKSQ